MVDLRSSNLRIEVGPRQTIGVLRSWNPTDTGLPTQVGTVIVGSSRVLCIGPSTWLAVGGAVPAREGLICVDGTDATLQIQISGPASDDLLSTVCALDFHPRAFPIDACRRTRLAGLPVVIDRRGEQSFECYAAASYLPYLLVVLRDSAIGLEEHSQ